MVEFAHNAMGRQISPSCAIPRSSQCSTTDATGRSRLCTILYEDFKSVVCFGVFLVNLNVLLDLYYLFTYTCFICQTIYIL